MTQRLAVRFFTFLAIGGAAAVPPAVLYAQSALGSINGVITDRSGAAVPEAAITLINLQTGGQRAAATTALGYYNFPALPPAPYRLAVSKKGFAIAERKDVELQVQQNMTVDITLLLEGVTQALEVQAEAPMLDSTNATVGQVINAKQTVDLPLNGRQFSQLLLLSPGNAPKGGGQQPGFTVQIGGGGISPAVNGVSGNFNNYTMDGLDNNSKFTNIWAVAPPPDAIQEFKVESGDYAGAGVNIATRSGTDSFHGALWEFLRNGKTDARNTFDAQKPPYQQNQYGFSAGGPVMIPKLLDGRKTHSWISGYYEGFRSRRARTYFATVPTAAALGGDFSQFLGAANIGTDSLGRPYAANQLYDPFSSRPDPSNAQLTVRDPYPGNRLPAAKIDPTALAYISHFYPAADLPTFPNNFVALQSTAINSDQLGARFDQRIGESDSLFVRFNYFNANSATPTALPNNPLYIANLTRTLGGTYTHIFSPGVILTASFSYSRDFTPEYYGGVSEALQQLLGITRYFPPFAYKGNHYLSQEVTVGPTYSPTANLGGFLGGPDYSYQLPVAMTKVSGNHTISFGIVASRYSYITNPDGNFDMTFTQQSTANPQVVATTGDALASLLLSLPTTSLDNVVQYKSIHGYIIDPYIHDQWKINPKLTVNLGLQWTYMTGPHYVSNHVSNFNIHTGTWEWATTNPVTGQPANMSSTLYNPEYNNFAPRIGVAYLLTKKTVLRGGYSTFYDHGNTLIQINQEVEGAYPYTGRTSVSNLNVGLPTGVTLENPLPPAATVISPLNAPAFAIDPLDREPRIHQWNFGIQQELAANTVLTVNYVGTQGRRLLLKEKANVATSPGSGPVLSRVPFPQFPSIWTEDTDKGTSDYHALQAKVEKRYSGGLTFLGSYTWSKALGDVSGPQESNMIQDPYNLSSDRGPLNYDVKHMFVASAVYELPIGKGRAHLSSARGITNALLGNWNAAGILTFYTGLPITANLTFDNANTLAINQRPNLVGSLVPSGFNQTRHDWFSTSAFAAPAPFTYGSEGANVIRAPGVTNLDFSVYKQFAVTESRKLEFRFESFNFLNNTNLMPPNTSFGGASFGVITSARDPRDVQFGLKFLW